MNRLSKIAMLTACLTVGAKAQFVGLGYDTDLNEITGRVQIMPNALIDVGAGLKLDNTKNIPSDSKFQLSASAFFLGHLQHWGPVDTYFTAGGIFAKLPTPTDNISFSLFAGFQPEVTLLDHIVISTRFGFDIPLAPSFILQTAGAGISIVNGANFKILF